MSPSPEFANEIDRLMRDPDALRAESARMRRSDGRGHYDPTQPRVPAGNSDGGQWTDADAGDRPLVQRARVDRLLGLALRPAQKGLEAALALFTALSARNMPGRQAIIEFNAREFRTDAQGERVQANVDRLNRDQVNEACPRFGEVQSRTDHADQAVSRGGGIMSRQQFGTFVHTHLKRQIESLHDPNFRAEVSRLKGQENDVRHGKRGSIRIDVIENAGGGTVCVYDIKTGASGLSPARMAEIAHVAFKHFPNTQRIIVTEVRPRR
jgi:hypothetical protein